ncbi:MAG: hypothetical protein DRJ67_08580 [Thermoprotei archaeon]|nr:MAG: hypothetical protein DRJ67_08580 [Thermoprotei archaeon]
MRTRTRHRKKGMTALQAAILTGVSIAVALIVGYWIWTVVVGSIRTERLALTIPSAEYTTSLPQLGTSGWVISLRMANNGPSDSTIVDIRINGKSITTLPSDTVYVNVTVGTGTSTILYEWYSGESNPKSSGKTVNGIPIRAGEEATVAIELQETPYRSGQTIEIAFVTAANQVYTSSIALP